MLIQAFGSESPYHFVIRSVALPLRPQRADVAKIAFGGDNQPEDTFVILGKWNGTATAVFAAARRKVTINGEFYYYKDTHARAAAPVDSAAQDLSIKRRTWRR